MGLSLIVAEARPSRGAATAGAAGRGPDEGEAGYGPGVRGSSRRTPRRAGAGYSRRVIAFLPTLGFQEMVVLLVLGILLFGRNLPDVGRQLGRTMSQLKRGMQEFKDQMNRDESVRELRDTVRDTRNEIPRAGAGP